MTPLRLVGDRVLIRPEPPVEETPSGLVLVEHKKPAQSGTVIAVGRPVHPRRGEAVELAGLIESCESQTCLDPECQAGRLLLDLTRLEPAVAVGDYVIFSWQVGQEVSLPDTDETYLLMREDDILCVVESER